MMLVSTFVQYDQRDERMAGLAKRKKPRKNMAASCVSTYMVTGIY